MGMNSRVGRRSTVKYCAYGKVKWDKKEFYSYIYIYLIYLVTQ